MDNTTSDRIVLLESTDGEIRITATEQRIFIVTPFNAAFKDEIKARFGARWNGSTREWSIAFRYRDDLDPLLYNHFGVSMIAEVTTPSLMKVAIDAQRLYQVSGAGSEINLAGSRVAVRWGRDEAVKVYRGVFKKDGEDFKMPRSGGSMRRPRIAGCGELDGATLETEITPAELDWLRENEIDFELLDGGESAEPQPEDPQLDPEDLNGLHEDDDTWDVDDDDEDRIYVQEEEEPAEVESEVETKSDEDKEEKEMKKNLTDGEDFMAIDPITMDDKREMEMETKMNEERIAETKARSSFCLPTNKNVVKAWEAFARRVMAVYDPDMEVEIERGSSQVFGVGEAGDIIRGIELRMEDSTPADDLEAWMMISEFTSDVLPRFANPTEDRALLLVNEWNAFMDAIAHDEEEASPDVRQAAKDQKIIALGRQNGSVISMEVYDDTVGMDEILGLREPNGTSSVMLYYTTPDGVHAATYLGWDGPDVIIYAGGYVDGSFVRSDEVDRAGLFDKLSEDVRAELEPLAGDYPGFWNGKILELLDDADPKDVELLEALWIGEEVYGGEVTVYGIDDDVTNMDESDFEILGLHRIESDEDDEDEDDEDDM